MASSERAAAGKRRKLARRENKGVAPERGAVSALGGASVPETPEIETDKGAELRSRIYAERVYAKERLQ